MKRISYKSSYEEVEEAVDYLISQRSDLNFKKTGWHIELRNGQFSYASIIELHALIDDKQVYYYTNHIQDIKDAKNNKKFIDEINKFFQEPIDWNRRFLKMASGEINTWSKDPSTKVSATIFRGKYPIASSYNGFPPGIEDTLERLNNRELKYKLVQHAEANAIATCSKLGISTDGCTIAVTHFPCSTCAGQIITAGIKKVIVKTPTEDFMSRWKDTVEFAQEMFKEAEVELIIIDLDESV